MICLPKQFGTSQIAIIQFRSISWIESLYSTLMSTLTSNVAIIVVHGFGEASF